ncbi:hypothetical protein [Nocardia sp. NPDC019395]|uniref:hypothetical protein n=1 Tax=Nocardia sp. NPDC019395 TaxID=3154686 RepID=UPI0033C84CC1
MSEQEIVANLKNWLPTEVARLREAGEWPQPGGPQSLTFGDFRSWHREYLGEPFDPGAPVENMLNPNLMDAGNPVNAIVRYRVDLRESSILDDIDAEYDRGSDVIAGYGSSHYTAQKEHLDEKYGEPVIYRHGQLSGDLLLGGGRLTEADIRAGIEKVEGRIAGSDDPIVQQLWSEELAALRYESGRRY